jgi:hypothetical protein
MQFTIPQTELTAKLIITIKPTILAIYAQEQLAEGGEWHHLVAFDWSAKNPNVPIGQQPAFSLGRPLFINKAFPV